MASERPPLVIAYDGSEPAKAAVRCAAELFPDRPALVATVWEPGLAAMAWGVPPGVLGGDVPLDPETVRNLDRTETQHASRVAEEGAELARASGLEADAQVVPEAADIADTLVSLADERKAAAIVVGSHGMTGIRAAILGSVAKKLVSHGDRPVVVIRGGAS
jgi:nucleotide-binding universal stress UspA family protein